MEVLETIERVFRSRGYELMRSSGENRYLLLEKEGSPLAVGYSLPPDKVTEGEADMFISMAQNDSARSMLFISTLKLPKDVRKLFENGGVATWDRAGFAIAVGELIISEWSAETGAKPMNRSIMDLFQTQDVNPVKELRQYHREIREKEVGGFTVKEVELDSSGSMPTSNGERPHIESIHPPQKKSHPDEEPIQTNDETFFDLGGLPLVDPVDTEAEGNRSGGPQTVPEEILINPWAGFDEWSGTKMMTEVQPNGTPMGSETDADGSWKEAILAPIKYRENDALSLAGEEIEFELERSNQPFLLLHATYTMVPEDGSEPVDLQGTYLYDSIRTEVMDVPEHLFKEIGTLTERWTGDHPPKKLPDLKGEYQNAVVSLRKRISKEKLAQDRMVRETVMSTIYKEIKFRFDTNSLRLHSSRKVMLPFWIKKDAEGKVEWEVNAYLGRLVGNHE